jgi:rubredoxin
MSEQAKPMVKCEKCEHAFEPDLGTNKAWLCPACGAKNPNLKRLYRSVAVLFILGLIATSVAFALSLPEEGLGLFTGLQAAQGALLLVAIVIIYRSRIPWTDGAAKAFVWIPLLVAAFLNVALPLLLGAPVAIGYLVVYPIIFIYLLQLSYHARKCAVRPPRRG